MSHTISLRIVFPVIFLTFIFALAGIFFPVQVEHIQYPLFIILVLIIGLPHGATDYLLFRRLNGNKIRLHQTVKFFIIYLSAIFGFLTLWLILPTISFAVFIILSAYHFGQSNWENALSNKVVSHILNITWGAFAIGGAVLWHWGESNIIITQLVGYKPDFTNEFMGMVQFLLVLLNILFIVLLVLMRKISLSRFLNEIFKLTILSIVFYFTPMLISFTIYFTLWHSLSSLLSQMAFYKKLWPSFTIKDYYIQAAPYTLAAIIGLVIMIFIYQTFSPGISSISIFMIFIASMTLPHIFLVEQSYH
ncbi:MAG: Brp/Blh family beta-carotene 15,15'-dioxygenase [Saprospiraceae bacterium]|nr:Brp/Blh family beta-carotene 15,15'-dioxygenase [Saprospiraceae bacterium]